MAAIPPDREPDSLPDDPEDGPDPIEEIVAACLERPESEWTDAFEEACRVHPEQAGILRRRLAVLERTGLLEQPEHAAEEDRIPETLGDYRLIRELGGGGMGVIYLAQHQDTGAEVALKLVRPDQLYFPGARRRFQREVRSIARLEHPGIVPVLDVGEENGIPYLAMERVEGCTLAEILQELEGDPPAQLQGRDLFEAICQCAERKGGEPILRPAPEAFQGSWVDAVVRLFIPIAQALHHAHECGVLHRDVKPSNIMVTPEGRALLLDFGLARAEGTSRMTRTGVTLGSLPYMAPEQLQGDQDLDARVDVYSLGVTLYEMLCLQAPFSDANADRLRQQILHREAPGLRARNPRVRPDLAVVCLKAFDRNRAHRYPSAAGLADDLQRAAQLQPIQGRRTSTWRRARRMVRRHPVLAAAVALVVLQVGVAQTLIVMNYRQQRDAAQAAQGLAEEARRRTEDLRSQTEANLRETRELLEAAWLRALPLQAEDLYPLDERRVPDVDQWLQRAQDILRRRAVFEKELEDLREEARASASPVSYQPRIDQLQRSVDQLNLLARLQERVSRDREYAANVRWLTLDSPEAQAAWKDAIDDIFLLEVYDGLELEPQLGLLPLGPDLDSGLWEFWHVQSGERPERPLELSNNAWDVGNDTGIILVLMPGGGYEIGAQLPDRRLPPDTPHVDASARPDEGPVHKAYLEAFFLSKYELTQAQWARLALYDATPSTVGWPRAKPGTRPLESVNWYDALRWLRRTGLTLPTEAQWEVACRAGTGSPYFFGTTRKKLVKYANFADLSLGEMADQPTSFTRELNDGVVQSAPIGTYRANAWGLYDVLGNVSEFTLDGEAMYQDVPRPGDGLRKEAKAPGWVIVRGGSWLSLPGDLRSSARAYHPIHQANRAVGIRPARAIARSLPR